MTCQTCGGRIPVSAAPSPAPTKQPDDDTVRLQCPVCKQVFTPLFDLKTHIGGTNCPNCGSDLPLPLEKNIVNPDQPPSPPTAASRASGPPPAAAFLFGCSVVSFIAGDIAAIADSVALSSCLYWSGVSFILMAIYLKIQWK